MCGISAPIHIPVPCINGQAGKATGVAPSFAIESFNDLDADVRQSVLRVRRSDFLLHTDRVRGFVYDVDTHLLREVDVPDE